MRGVDTRVSVCFCLGSRYTPDTQPDTQIVTLSSLVSPPLETLSRNRLVRHASSAGWSADVQRWESDEDSEDSEGEWAEDEKVGVLSEAQILRLMA